MGAGIALVVRALLGAPASRRRAATLAALAGIAAHGFLVANEGLGAARAGGGGGVRGLRRIGTMSEPAAPRVESVLTCPICGSSQRRPFAVFEDRIYEVPGRYAYAQCRACETVFQDPRVLNADLELLYPEAYITHGAVEEAVEGAPESPAAEAVRAAARAGTGSRAGHRCGPGRPAAGG